MTPLKIFRAVFIAALLLCGSGHAFATGYDAIAVDDEPGLKGGQAGYGVGEGTTAEDANAMALKNCKSSGNGKCTLALTYQRCGAYASSREHSGSAMGATESEARSAAKEQCGVGACRVVVADCVGK